MTREPLSRFINRTLNCIFQTEYPALKVCQTLMLVMPGYRENPVQHYIQDPQEYYFALLFLPLRQLHLVPDYVPNLWLTSQSPDFSYPDKMLLIKIRSIFNVSTGKFFR